MANRNSLTDIEVGIIKKLLAMKQHSNQEIAGLINRSRGDASKDVSSGRITNIKQDDILKYIPVVPANDDEVSFFMRKLDAYDPQTGLNFYDDERLIRAREAMMLAVQVFNSPILRFKTEVFAMLANVAWTYLMHEYYLRKGVKIFNQNGKTIELSKLLRRNDCPLSDGAKTNLISLKTIRDEVEHRLFGKSDVKWLSLFQACCLNFDKALCNLFNDRLSLKHELAFALQFSKLSVDQITTIQKYDIPENIDALDARLTEGMSEEDLNDLEYRFRVIYTLDSASKSQSHLNFVSPTSDEGAEIRNILVKHKPADELYPYKPGKVCEVVSKRSGHNFTPHNHTQSWKKFKVRPRNGARRADSTKIEYCIYHAAHRDYTYSEKWVDYLVGFISTENGFEEIKSFRV